MKQLLLINLAVLVVALGCSQPPARIASLTSQSEKKSNSDDSKPEYEEDKGLSNDNPYEVPGDKDKDGVEKKPPVEEKVPEKKPEVPAKSEEELLKESSAKAMAELDKYVSGGGLYDIGKQDFASLGLTKGDAEKARLKLFDALKNKELTERSNELRGDSVSVGGTKMRFLSKTFGNKPANGYALYISLHGGGMAPAEINDGQWRNQIGLYQPTEAIYVAPRAPTDTWDLWQLPHIDALFERMIGSYIIAGLVDPNRIYFMGYSAGGDGLYQLAPRLADRIAAGAMMAGHPGDASPISLRNIGFSIHCGADDSAYDRNKLAGEWLKKLDDLEKANAGSYKHFGRVVEGKGHWMDLVDKEAVPWMAKFTRDPFPKKISWHQDDVMHQRFYWIKNDKPKAHTELNSEINGQTIVIKDNMEGKIFVLLNDGMLDLSKPITIERNGKKKEGLKAKRTISVIAQTLLERADPLATYNVELEAP